MKIAIIILVTVLILGGIFTAGYDDKVRNL